MLVVRKEALQPLVLAHPTIRATLTLNVNLNVKSTAIVRMTSLVSRKSVGILVQDHVEQMLIVAWLAITRSVAVRLDTLVTRWNLVELHLQLVRKVFLLKNESKAFLFFFL